MWTCWCELHVLPGLAPNCSPFATPSQPGQLQSEHNGSKHHDAWKQPTKSPARRVRPQYCSKPGGTEALGLNLSHRAAQEHTSKQPKPLQIFMSLLIGKFTSRGTACSYIRLHLLVTTSVNNMMAPRAPSQFHTISINCRFSNRIPESHKTVSAVSSGGPLHIFKTHQDFWCSLRYQRYFYLAWMPVQLVTHFTGSPCWQGAETSRERFPCTGYFRGAVRKAGGKD